MVLVLNHISYNKAQTEKLNYAAIHLQDCSIWYGYREFVIKMRLDCILRSGKVV